MHGVSCLTPNGVREQNHPTGCPEASSSLPPHTQIGLRGIMSAALTKIVCRYVQVMYSYVPDTNQVKLPVGLIDVQYVFSLVFGFTENFSSPHSGM